LLTAGVWSIALIVILLRVAIKPEANTVFTTFAAAGAAWIRGAPLYTNYRGFVYSPQAAACFAPVSMLPTSMSNILWRLINVMFYLGAVVYWLRAGVHQWIRREHYWVVFLLLLPLSIGNINNGQVNPLVIGLIMIAILAARSGHWNLAALCVAVCAYLKIYPVAVGLLLVALYPKQFTWRFLLMLIALGLIPFILQRQDYVLEQYRHWFITRAGDDRKLYKLTIAPRDLWMLLRLTHIEIRAGFYVAIQASSGAAIAAICLAGRWRSWSQERLWVTLLSLSCSWMLLCGPATESATYILLAPAITLAMVQLFVQATSTSMRLWVAISYALLLFALQLNSFFHLKKTVAIMSIQPAAALVFGVLTLAWVHKSSCWKRPNGLAELAPWDAKGVRAATMHSSNSLHCHATTGPLDTTFPRQD
jgi:hypothetical protein